MAFLKFVPIMKVDVARREVYGVVTSETPDKDGEICDYASTVPHYQAWSAEFEKATEGKSKGNVREMHTHSAVGKVAELVCDDAAKTIAVRARIVDDEAWRKCQEGVYTGFSHGGEYIGELKPEGAFKRYTARPTEISLVDNPCNPDAHFEYVKADGSIEMRKFLTPTTETQRHRETLEKREVSDKERERLAEEGHAMADGSYPIANVEDLKNAIQAYGRAKDPEAVKRHIIRRAKELGHTDLLPADWSPQQAKTALAGGPDRPGSTKKEDAVDPADLTKAGAKHSKETLETLRQMQKSHEGHHQVQMQHHEAWLAHHTEMEKCFGKLFGDGDGKDGDGPAGRDEKAAKAELVKVSGERDALKAELQKAESTLKEVNEKLAKLLAEPRPAKAAKNTVAVSKDEDAAGGAAIPLGGTKGKPGPTGDKDVLKACLAQPV
jgi:hypothetical protein